MQSRRVKLYATKKNIELLGYQREAMQLRTELDRLSQRIEQVRQLLDGYHQQMAMPEMTGTEYMTIVDIYHRLSERRRFDESRFEVLDAERARLAGIMVQKKREVEKLEDKAKVLRIQEIEEKEEKAEKTLPAPRPRSH
jgi:predicted  nucleic acid-binding Zn-ribbon protein